MLARGALVLIALVAVAWMALGLRTHHRETRASQLLAFSGFSHQTPAEVAESRRLFGVANVRRPTPAQLGHLVAIFDAAAHLNSDPGPRIDEAFFFLNLGRPRRAAALLEDVVRREPDQIGAWAELAQATARSDPRRSAQALARVRELDPLGGS